MLQGGLCTKKPMNWIELMQTSNQTFGYKKEEFIYLILPLLEKVLGLSETNDNLQCTMSIFTEKFEVLHP
jgi:hypothetical protein